MADHYGCKESNGYWSNWPSANKYCKRLIFRLNPVRLFHISEDPDIRVFEPRTSPSYFEGIRGKVVFAVSETVLHTYLLPRDCPRVTFYPTPKTSARDREKFFGNSLADFVIAVEQRWYQAIQQVVLYCYEFPVDNFTLLDQGAGYYISYESVIPIAMQPKSNVLEEFQNRKVELRVLDTLGTLAKEVSESTLQYSLIRMRNAAS